jgi:hypothetical protein
LISLIFPAGKSAPATTSRRALFEPHDTQDAPIREIICALADIPTDAAIKLNLQDPDSMTLDPQGNIVLDSQGDQELIIVSNPGSSNQRVLHLPLSFQTASGPKPVEVDDTAFVTSTEGFILFADAWYSSIPANAMVTCSQKKAVPVARRIFKPLRRSTSQDPHFRFAQQRQPPLLREASGPRDPHRPPQGKRYHELMQGTSRILRFSS